MIDPEDLGARATLAAGLLEAAGELQADLTVGEARDRLRSLLTPASLWVGGVASSEDDQHRPALWVRPTVPIGATLATGLDRAIGRLTTEPASGKGAPILRVSVGDLADADRVADLASDDLLVAPAIIASVERFQWRWPLRVGVIAGPKAERWVQQLRRQRHADQLFEVRIEDRDPGTTDPLDILLVDAKASDLDLAAAIRPFQATCVMAVGSSADAAELLDRVSAVPSAISVGVPIDGVRWFEPLVDSMARDLPIDVAIAETTPAARIIADPEAAALTAVGRWGRELSKQLRPIHRRTAGSLAAIVGSARFGREDLGAGVLAATSAGLESVGFEATVVVDRETAAMAAAPPMAAADEVEAEATAEAPPPVSARVHRGPKRRRELLATVVRDGVAMTAALRPRTTYQLVVRIAVPAAGEDGIRFEGEDEVPTGDGVAELVVDVSKEIGGTIGSATIMLPTLDRTRPSTNAVIRFRTGADGSTLHLRITVLHQGRAIQAAALVAPVRLGAVAGDRVQLLPALLTAAPEPDLTATRTRADASLDARRTTISRLDGDRDQFVDLATGAAILSRIATKASNVLSLDSAPDHLDDPDALRLLIQLARDGRSFRRLLEPLALAGCGTIEVVVAASTPIIPFELVYEGPAPSAAAELCTHQRPPAPGAPCARASTTRVCPYAFWGSYRVFARTIQHARSPGSASRPPLRPLALTPALYAAADRADHASRAKVPPTGKVEAELRKLVGDGAVERVDTWPKWRRAVGKAHPQLLVVLGHSDIGPNVEPVIEIGADSLLAQPDVTRTYLWRQRSPAPLVLLLSCSSGVDGSPFGTMAATFAQEGAAAVVATLTQLTGPQGAKAGIALLRALHPRRPTPVTLGVALTDARRALLAQQLVLGLLIVAHGEIDVELT